MPKKIKIDVDLAEGNTLIGIACHKKDYWLAYQLNNTFGIKLRRQHDFPQVTHKGHQESLFPLFYAAFPEEQRAYYLLSNSNQESLLIPALRSTDYFLLIQGMLKDKDVDSIVKAIRAISGVLTAFIPDTGKLKDYPLLLTDLELFTVSTLGTG